MLRSFSHFYNAPNPSNQSFDNTISYHKLSYIKFSHIVVDAFIHSQTSMFLVSQPLHVRIQRGTRGPD